MQESDHANRLARREAAVDELQAEGERLRLGRTRSMGQAGRRPVRGTAPVPRFRAVAEATHKGVVDVALHKERSFWGDVGTAGSLEAFLCRGCRLVEWRAASTDGLEPDGDEVVELAAVETD